MISPKRALRVLQDLVRRIGPLLAGFWVLALLAEAIARPGEASFFHLWLLAARDAVLPGGILLLVWNLAARYVRALYGAESLGQGRSFLFRSVFGMPSFQPYAILREGRALPPRDPVLLHAGGPGSLVIYRDTAALLERAGRFVRVAGRGFAALRAWDRVYATVDLRPQRRQYDVGALSKEGIPVTCRADITFQLAEGDQTTAAQAPSLPPDLPSALRQPILSGDPFPMDPDVVFQATTCAWVREARRPPDSRIMDWADRLLISEMEPALRSILARYPLDQLVGLPAMDSNLLQQVRSVDTQGAHAREAIREDLEKALWKNAGKLGARILKVNLGEIEVPGRIGQEWIENVKAEAENWARRHLAEGEADAVRLLEEGIAETMARYLANVGNMLANLAHPETVSSLLVLANMVDALKQVASDPLTLSYMPQQTLDTLTAMSETIAGLLGTGGPGEPPLEPEPTEPS